MTQPNLFDAPESLSPEAEWLKKHDVAIVQVTEANVGDQIMDWMMEPTANWFAFVRPDEVRTNGFLPKGASDDLKAWFVLFMAECESCSAENAMSNGFTRDEAIVELSRQQRWKTPMQARYEIPTSPCNSAATA